MFRKYYAFSVFITVFALSPVNAYALKGTVKRVAPGGGILTAIVENGSQTLFCITSNGVTTNMDAMTAILGSAQATGTQVIMGCNAYDNISTVKIDKR